MVFAPFVLPGFVQRRVDELAAALLTFGEPFDFSRPDGEEALIAPTSVSWRIFKNPFAVFIGGVTAVLLELAEPRVRTGVWEHSSFKTDPVGRLKRTGRAAMITVYGPKRAAEAMIAHVVRMHERVQGTVPHGETYRANDPELLTWVQATASFGFTQSYHTYVRLLDREERQRLFEEGLPSAALYGATGAPTSENEWRALLEAMRPRLEPSQVLRDFLSILRAAPVFPAPAHGLQGMMIRAAVDLVPEALREKLDLADQVLRPGEAALVKLACGLADRIVLNASPAAQSCRRLGLPADFLYRPR